MLACCSFACAEVLFFIIAVFFVCDCGLPQSDLYPDTDVFERCSMSISSPLALGFIQLVTFVKQSLLL